MSPRREPRSLYLTCVAHVSNVLDSYCQNEDPFLSEALQYVSTHLPIPLQASIGEAVVQQVDNSLRLLSPRQVQMLLRLRATRLSMSGSVVESGIVENEDAGHLRKLTLCYIGCEDRVPRIYRFLGSATSLTHLECTNFCNDNMISIIASACKNLYCLDLRNCCMTDIGVINLCGLNLDLKTCINLLSKGVTLLPLSPCSITLRELKITMTNIMEPGVAIILLILTKLTLLRVPDMQMDKIFTFLKALDHKNVQCNLKEFHSRQRLDGSQLKVLTCLCPNLEYIQVSFMGDFDMDMSRIQQLTHLSKLTRAKFADVDSSALLWFLTQMGNQMKHLYLYSYPPKLQEKIKISRAQLHCLALLCVNLENLCLDGYCLTDNNQSSHAQTNFKKLKTLKLKSICLTEEDLNMFLCECYQMTELEIILQNPHLLHDNFIDQILSRGTWRNVSRIRILNAPLTSKTIVRLINECPVLTRLSSVDSWLITKTKAAYYKERVHVQNYNLEIF